MAASVPQWTEACGLTPEEFESCIHLLARMNGVMISFNNYAIQTLPSEILQNEANFTQIISDAQGLSETKKSSLLSRANRVHLEILHFEPYKTGAVTEDIRALIKDIPRNNRDQFEVIGEPCEESEQDEPGAAPSDSDQDLMQYHPWPENYPSTGSTVYSTGKGYFPNVQRNYFPSGSANVFSHGTISFPIRTVRNPIVQHQPYSDAGYSSQDIPGYSSQDTSGYPRYDTPGYPRHDTSGYPRHDSTGYVSQDISGCYRHDTTGDPSNVTSGYYPPGTTDYLTGSTQHPCTPDSHISATFSHGTANNTQDDENCISDDQLTQVFRDLGI